MSFSPWSWLLELPWLAGETCLPHCQSKGPSFIISIKNLRAVWAWAGILLREGRVFSPPKIILLVFLPYSRLFPLCIYFYANKITKPFGKHLQCPSRTALQGIFRKTGSHRCLQLMNMQLWHLKLLSRFQSPSLHWHQFTPNHKGFQVNSIGGRLLQILPEGISVPAS